MMSRVSRRDGVRTPRVVFVTLSRRWWRGALLTVVLLAGATLALYLDEGTVDVFKMARQQPASSFDERVIPVSTLPSQSDTAAADSDVAQRSATLGDDELVAAPVSAQPAVTATVVRSHPFDILRLERDRQRSRQAELLQAAAQDPTAGEQRRQEAHNHLLALWAMEAREIELEHLLAAQGYTGVVVLTASGAHVVVDGVLDAPAASFIGELVHSVAGVRREAITIVDGTTSGR